MAYRFGMSTIMDIFERISKNRGWLPDDNTPGDATAGKEEEKKVWNVVMEQLHEPFEILSEVMDQGLQHSGLVLEILPHPKRAKTSGTGKSPASAEDLEKKGDAVEPGDSGFAAHLQQKIQKFHSCRHRILQAWANEVGLVGNEDDVDKEVDAASEAAETSMDKRQRDKIQLFILLYMAKLVSSLLH
jgi:hypothetical protein